MAITKSKKAEIVSDLDGRLQGIKSAVFVNFHKLNVADATALRRKLREQGVGYRVAKKTLIKRALGNKQITGDMPDLTGEVAVAYSDDLITPAREVYSFQKDHKDNISIIGGVFDGRYMSQAEMMTIALIPPIRVLYAQFVNLINSPIQRMAVVLSQITEKKQ